MGEIGRRFSGRCVEVTCYFCLSAILDSSALKVPLNYNAIEFRY